MFKIKLRPAVIMLEISLFVASGYIFKENKVFGLGLFILGFLAALTAGEMIKKEGITLGRRINEICLHYKFSLKF